MTQDWTLEEALAYYRRQGAPGEQGALVALLREVQEERGGALPAADLAESTYTAFLESYGQDLGMASYGACVDRLVARYCPLWQEA